MLYKKINLKSYIDNDIFNVMSDVETVQTLLKTHSVKLVIINNSSSKKKYIVKNVERAHLLNSCFSVYTSDFGYIYFKDIFYDNTQDLRDAYILYI